QAPDKQRLAEIALFAAEAGLGGDIEQPADAERRIDHKAAGGDAGTVQFALQRVVDEEDRLLHVVEGAAHRVAALFRDHRDVDLGHRLEQDAVEKQVEVEDFAVQRLERIVGLFERGPVGRILGRRCATGEHGGDEEAGGTANSSAGGDGDSHEKVRELG